MTQDESNALELMYQQCSQGTVTPELMMIDWPEHGCVIMSVKQLPRWLEGEPLTDLELGEFRKYLKLGKNG